jgi:hypothetical protein
MLVPKSRNAGGLALASKSFIADGEHFVHENNLGTQLGGDSKA